jgi:pectate lyase
MKAFALISFFLPALALAAPASTFENRNILAKRASVDDVPTTGFATQNGGTTGGKGGQTTTVTTVAELKAAVADNTPRIVIVSGSMTGTDSIKIGSNKTIVGKDSNASKSRYCLV